MNINQAFEHVKHQISTVPEKANNLINKLPTLTEEQKIHLDLFIGGLTIGSMLGIIITHLIGGI